MAETEEGEVRGGGPANPRRLGRGLSGYVYETTWGGKKCARKDFPLGSVERNNLFEREVKKACKLDAHLNVVKCFDYTIGTNSCSVVQEYVADNLQSSVQRRIDEEVIRRRGTSRPGPPRVLNLGEIKRLLSSRGEEKEMGKRKVADAGAFEAVPEAADIILQIAAGMRHLHEDGVVHGDLKPRNVLVLNPDESGGWKVKLADYGLTETKKRIRMVSERTRRAEILTWKAPECLGRKKSDHGSPDGDFLTEFDVDSDEEIEHVDDFLNSKLAMADVYSFGLTCSYILGGKPMSSDMNLRQQRMKGFKPKLPESVSLEYLKFVIGACLDPEPLKRPAFFMICMMEVAPSHLRLQMLRNMMEGRWRESVLQIPCEIGSVDPPEQINNMSTFSGVIKLLSNIPLQHSFIHNRLLYRERCMAASVELEHSADSMDCSHPHPDPRALVQLDVDKTDASSSCARRLHEPKIKYDIFINHRGPDTKLQFVISLEDALKEKHYTPFVDRSLEVGTHAFEAIEAAIKDASVHVPRMQDIIAPRNALHRRQPVPRPNVGGKELLEGKLQQLEEMGDNVAILGICGMGGMGKTTLAQEIYNHYSASGGFLYLTFLEIGELEDVSPLQKQALRELLNKKEKNLVELYVSTFERLVGMKVLIVIDDISKAEHFKELVPNIKKLGAGSRIILTSRRKDTLRVAMSTVPEIATILHQMKELNPSDSFELFWFHAFHNRELPQQTDDIFRPLAEKVLERCSGLPLALKIIGEHLCGKPEKVWKDAAKSMRERPGIIDVLSISYDGLDSRSEKMMFLDVSCQMFGLLEEDAVDIWKSCESCRPPSGCITSKMVHDSLHVLKDKSLVEVDKDGRLTMHDLLKEMGRKMDADDTQICAKNGRLSFHLWDPLDAKDALDNDEGTKDVRGLSLVGLNSSYDAKTFKSMPNIHLLQLDGARIEGDFSQMSKKIRWLQWRVALFTELPQFDLEHLAILDVSESRNLVRLWSDSGTKVPKLLRVLLLHNCIALEKLPETIKSVTMLRALNLQGCKSLKELPDSLDELRELEDLNLSECECLEGLPDGMVKLSKLKTFSMNGCSNIKQLPVDFGELSGSLTIFSAQDASSLTCLPDSFSRLSRLEELRLSHCLSFTEFPKSVKSLAKLRVISLHATGLTHLPDDFGELPSLVELHLNCCNSLESLPEGFGNLSQLKVLSLQKSEKFRILSSTFGQLQGLTDLNLEQCSIGDGDFPANFGGLKRLTTLLMQKNKMTTLPDSFRDLEALATLNMRGSLDLTNVQALPPYMEELFLACCPKIVGVNLVDKLSKLRKLILFNCTRLTDIEGLESTVSLNHINLSGCVSLSKIYENLLFISTLKECYISGIKVCLKYNNNWSQVGAPSAQVVSYYDHAIGFMDNTMTRKICSVQDANELCVEARISTTSVAAVVIAVVAHDQGFSDYPHLHGEYNGNCNIEARIVRSDGEVPVFSSQLLALRHADCRDQVYVCTLRKSHPLITRLKEGDRICVYARSIYRGWRITVMKGGIWVVYDKKSPGPDNFPEGLYLKDGLARSIRLPRVVQAVTLPVLLQSFQAGAGGGSLPTAQRMMRCVCVPIFGDMDTTSLQFQNVRSRYGRICDLCQTLLSSQRGWHCEVCDDIDMCEACFLSSTEKSDAQLPFPHESDHPMSVFEAPDSTEDAPIILMPYVKGEEETNWGYVVYEYSTVRWSETFE